MEPTVVKGYKKGGGSSSAGRCEEVPAGGSR